jgi:hypothetical protein
MAGAIDDRRFLPFLALHETEAWVLAAASELAGGNWTRRHLGPEPFWIPAPGLQ